MRQVKRPVVAADQDREAMPLHGFTLPEESFVLAESAGKAYRVFVPPGAAIEHRKEDGHFYPLHPSDLERVGQRRFLTLSNGMAARLSEGEMSLVAYVQPPLKKPFVNPFHGTPWLLVVLLLLSFGGLGAFLEYGPKASENADFQQRGLPPVAIRLISPEPKKKEEAKKKLEAIKAQAPKKKAAAAKAAKPAKQPAAAPAAPIENKALKALAKLSTAGPAMSSLLSAVDKLDTGPGPGAKSAKSQKLSGLIGNPMVANAGLGSFGLGGPGGGSSFGTKGAEILRGKGGGIGALGSGGIGRGAVGGTVTRASARSVSAQGSIDREAVAKVVNSHLQEVRACYERALLKEPGLAGKVVLEWTVSTAGKVVTAKTKTSSLRNSGVEGCILSSLKGWTFPPARGGVVIVSYPFLFNSVGY